MYAANQLGFTVATENLRKLVHERALVKLYCCVGFWAYNKKFNNNVEINYKNCTFYAKYQRYDMEDQKSPYFLSDFDISHNHPLFIRVIEDDEVD